MKYTYKLWAGSIKPYFMVYHVLDPQGRLFASTRDKNKAKNLRDFLNKEFI